MKISVKNLKGTTFPIDAEPEQTVAELKENIEKNQGKDVYPADEQMLIFRGKVLIDTSTLTESGITENSCIVIMLKKKQISSGQSSTTETAAIVKAPVSQQTSSESLPAAQGPQSMLTEMPSSTVGPTPSPALSPPSSTVASSDVYGQAASSLVAGTNLEGTIQQILDMGGGMWDRDTVVRALRAAFNNPERAVEYLYSGIPEQVEPPAVARFPTGSGSGQAGNPPPSQTGQTVQSGPVPPTGPNANPLDLFPQGLPNLGSNPGSGGSLDFLRSSPQFRALQALVQANPQVLQPMLQELGKQNPQLVRLIQDHQADFLRLINEPVEGGDGSIFGQLASAIPPSVTVTQEERESIERLEGLGFDRALVLEVFFACNKNEELAANYLLDHIHEFEE